MSNYISYEKLLQDRNNFRKAGAKSGSEFNFFDTPGHKYFRIFFYFNNGDSEGAQSIDASNGLLSPTWLIDGVDDKSYYMYNSAWSYLKMNDEDDRADLLKDFVNLLSNISSESPWYFSEITGLDAAMDRKAINDENFTIEPTRQKLVIKCLSDSVDDRIGTLLDLYRSIVWDWTTKREVIPANLRKFDMGIFIFETPYVPDVNSYINSYHKKNNGEIEVNLGSGLSKEYEYANIGNSSSGYIASYKYIELHNCEIDYNSSKNLYANLNNKEGMSIEHNIEIFFDDCYETRYNEFMMKEIGDLIKSSAEQRCNDNNAANELAKKIEYYKNTDQTKNLEILDVENPNRFKENRNTKKIPKKNNFIENSVNQLIGLGEDFVGGVIKKVVLGNLYTFSLSKLTDQVKGLIQGDIISTARHMDSYIRGSINKNRNKNAQITNSNLFPKKTILPTVKRIGQLYQGNTIANNI